MAQRPLIIGISGKKRHGKDTVGKMLALNHSFTRTAFADPLKLQAMELFWLTYDQCYGGPGIDRELIDPRWDLSPRQIMQRIGTEMGRAVHSEVWVRNTLKLIERAYAGEPVNVHLHEDRKFAEMAFAKGTAALWCITDCRFPNEAQAIRDEGGFVVKVVRPGMVSNDTHDSETSVDLVEEDHLIVNDGSLEDLATKVRALQFLVRRPAIL